MEKDFNELHKLSRLQRELDFDREKEKILLNSIPGGVAMYHIMQDGTVQGSYISEGLAQILGYTAKEFIERYGKDTRECVVAEDRHIIGAAIRNMLETHTPISNHYRCYTKSGGTVSLSFDGNVLELGEKMPGEIATLYAVQTLISDKHQQELQEGEIREKLLNYVPGGIGIYDMFNGVACLTYLNKAYCDMMCLKPQDRADFYGRDISGVVHPEDRHKIKAIVEDVQQGQRLINRVFRVLRGDGQWNWINLVMRVVEGTNGHFTGYANLYDYDGVVKAREAMEAAHKREETLLAGIPGGIAIYHVKKNGKIPAEYISPMLAKMCGYSVQELEALLAEDTLCNVVAEDVPVITATVAKAIAENQPISAVANVYRKDGSTILLRLDANIIKAAPLAQDEVAILYCVHTLVSNETKQMMEEKRTLSLLLNSVPAGIGIFQVEDGVINQEYMNDAFFKMLYSTRESRSIYAGKNATLSIHPDDLPRVHRTIDSMLQGAATEQVDYRLLNGLGSYTWFHVALSVTERREGYIKFYAAFFDCSESKEQELLLRQNQRAVAMVQEQGDLSIWIYNIDKGLITRLIDKKDNGRMGYDLRLENVPQTFIDSKSVHPEDIDKFLAAYGELARGKESVEVTYRLMDYNLGHFKWLRMYYRRMENTNDRDRIAVGFSMNVDKQQEAIERYKIEQALREQLNDNVMLHLEYNLTKGCYESEDKLPDSYRSLGFEGASLEDYKKHLGLFVEPEHVDAVAGVMYSENLLKAFANGANNVFVEYRCKARPNMPSLWFRTGASLVKKPDTGDIMAFIIVENIEKEKERKLAVEQSLSDGIESIAIINVSSKETNIITGPECFGKAQAEETFLYDDAFVNTACLSVVQEDREYSYRASCLATVIKELEQQENYQFSISVRYLNGQFKRQLFRYRYLDDRRNFIVLSISDITPVYLEEQAKKAQIEQALADTKKASSAKADFYSRMSHDMRTPMNGILGMAALSANEQDVRVLQSNMEKIRESGEYLLNLINDTLDIQRIESGKLKLEPRIVHTGRATAAMLEMVQPMAEAKGVTLEYDKGNANLDQYMRTDPVRIKQIFVNLLSNAIKFTPSGGTVRFSSRVIGRRGNMVQVVTTVGDTGIGMSEEFLKNGIFKPFSQESNLVTANYAGSGLGLSIVKSLVEMLGGTITVESEQGSGTSFSVTLEFEMLELSEAQRELEAKKTKHQDVSTILKDKSLLLVEDHPLNAEIAKRLLTRVGCRITWAQNGQLGVETFANSSQGFFDAVLMDIRMPVMDGLEATRAIRALARADAGTVPIIAMTANAYEEDVKKAVEAGMNAHLGKPIDPQKLYETLADRLANRA